MSASSSQSEIYTIFCIVIGGDSIFPIEIENNKTVGHLKNMIKEAQKPELDHIPASRLTLHQVSIPADKDFAGTANQLLLAEPTLEALNPTIELSELYKTMPPKKTVHIFVRVPETSKYTIRPRVLFRRPNPPASLSSKQKVPESGTSDSEAPPKKPRLSGESPPSRRGSF